jgi:hypothetical protein
MLFASLTVIYIWIIVLIVWLTQRKLERSSIVALFGLIGGLIGYYFPGTEIYFIHIADTANIGFLKVFEKATISYQQIHATAGVAISLTAGWLLFISLGYLERRKQ